MREAQQPFLSIRPLDMRNRPESAPLIPAHLMIDSPAAPDRHGGRRPAIHAYAARSKKIVDSGLRRHDAEAAVVRQSLCCLVLCVLVAGC